MLLFHLYNTESVRLLFPYRSPGLILCRIYSERRGDSVAVNIYGEQDLKIFESGVKYFR